MNKNLLSLKTYLEKNKNFNIGYGKKQDERIVSHLQEKKVLQVISKKFNIEIPKHRSWYDFSYKGKYVNIKITDPTKNVSDNLNSKEAIYLALTGDVYKGNVNWETFFKKLANNIKKNNEDYYYLVFFKNKKEILLTSLKCLEKLTPNGNNLPFQANWNKNKSIVKRSFKDATKFILKTLYQSIQKRAKIEKDFNKTNLKKYIC